MKNGNRPEDTVVAGACISWDNKQFSLIELKKGKTVSGTGNIGNYSEKIKL